MQLVRIENSCFAVEYETSVCEVLVSHSHVRLLSAGV
jgi:hypothetical protein